MEFGDPAFAVAGDVAEFIELGGVAVADDAAFFEVDGDFFGEGVAAEGAEFGEVEEVGGEGGVEFFCEREGGKVLAEGGDDVERLGEGLEVAGVAAALGEAAGGAFDVADVAEFFAGLGEEKWLGEEGGDDVLAVVEEGEVAGGVEDPFAEEAGAHRGVGAVDDAEEGVFAAGAGFDDVEVALGSGVDEHGVERLANAEGAEVGAVAAELVDEVVEGGTGGADGGGELGTAEAVEGFYGEVVFEEDAGLGGEEGVAIVGEGVF